MKNLLSFIAAFIFISANYVLTAQTILTKGTITMEITDVKSDDPQMEMGLAALRGSQTELIFNENQYITNMNMMGGMVSIKNVVSKKENKMNMLMDAMGQKIWVESDLDKIQTATEKEIASKSIISYDKNDTKEILGYKCYKMTLSNPEMEGMKLSGYITPEIKADGNIRGFEGVTFEGYPLEYTLENVSPAFLMTTTAVKIKDTADENQFKIDTKGYKKMTMEEFQKSMGGMGGF